MYKLKYYSLNKQEKEDLKKKFYATEFGHSIKVRLDRVFIIGILCIIFGLFLIITNTQIWDIISGISLLIVSIIFIFGSIKVRINKLNDFYIKKR